MSCGVCKVRFTSREQTLPCDGYCGNRYHPACCNVPPDISKSLGTIPGVSWHCDKCLPILKKCKPDFLKEMFEQKLDGVLKDMEDILLKMKNEIINIAVKKLEEVQRQIKNEFSQIAGNDMKEAQSTSFTAAPGVSKNMNLYSTALKGRSAVIIKPKNPNQKNYETKMEILSNINPVESEINISSIKNISEGGIVVGCEEISKFKDLVSSKLNEKYEVKDIKGISPRIKVVGMSEKLEEGELVKYAKCQNKTFFKHDDSECKVLRVWPTKKNQRIFQAILQIDVNSYNNIVSLGSGKLVIGFDVCDIYDSVALRCFNCNGFNHHSDKCKSGKIYCPRCSGEHSLKDCTVPNDNLKCINCIKFNEKNRDGKLDISHAAWDYKCPIYRQNVAEFKNSLYVS